MTGSSCDASIRALAREVAVAPNPKVQRIVATVDALSNRGAADGLIAPVRKRLVQLPTPRPLRFARLMFYPLDPLVVPAARWRGGQFTVPRNVLGSMAHHVRSVMGAKAREIEAAARGHTTAATELIESIGQTLWPAAAEILKHPGLPKTWSSTGLEDAAYRAFADLVGPLLHASPALHSLRTETANGLLPPRPEAVEAMLTRVSLTNPAAVPLMIALLLRRLPEAGETLPRLRTRPALAPFQAALDKACDILLQQLEDLTGAQARIVIGALAEAGGAVNRLVTLMDQLRTVSPGPSRQDQLRRLRQRLNGECQARFARGLQDEFLTPLARVRGGAEVGSLETIARGLRVLEIEARAVGGGGTYDKLLANAVQVVRSQDLSVGDRARLVEILAGPDAALKLLDEPKAP